MVNSMFEPITNENESSAPLGEDPQLVLDGTVNLDYSDEETLPRVKGLIEILEQYLGGHGR